MYEMDLRYDFEVDERTLSLHNSMIHVKNLHSHLQTWPSYCDDSGVRTQSYDCPPHIKVCQTPFIFMKWIQYEYEKWMRGPNHILQHVPISENPTENPTPAHPF